MKNASKEFELLINRYGFQRLEYFTDKEYAEDKLFILENEADLSDDFLKKKPNCITSKEITDLKKASELVVPEIPMLINTIENTYANIAVYGICKYADKIYNYLSGNKSINVFRINDKDSLFGKAAIMFNVNQKLICFWY